MENTEQSQNLSTLIAESGLFEELNELTGEITIVVNDSIALADKVDALASVIASFKQKADYARERKERWSAEQKTHENTIERLKAWVKSNMAANELKKLEGTEHKFTLASRADKLVINEDELPEEYFYSEQVTVRKVGKDTIEAALAGGIEIPGAHYENVHALTIK